MTPEQIRTATAMYVVAGLSIYSIGARLGKSSETVRKYLLIAGVTLRTGAAAQRAVAPHFTTEGPHHG